MKIYTGRGPLSGAYLTPPSTLLHVYRYPYLASRRFTVILGPDSESLRFFAENASVKLTIVSSLKCYVHLIVFKGMHQEQEESGVEEYTRSVSKKKNIVCVCEFFKKSLMLIHKTLLLYTDFKNTIKFNFLM